MKNILLLVWQILCISKIHAQNFSGQVKSYHLLDAQISYRIPKIKTTIKLAANNLTNQYNVQAYGSPAVGGLNFISLSFDELFK